MHAPGVNGAYFQLDDGRRVEVSVGEVVFEEVSSGAQNDLERVTKMAYAQVTELGFSKVIGPLSFKSDDNTLYKPFSEATARLIE